MVVGRTLSQSIKYSCGRRPDFCSGFCLWDSNLYVPGQGSFPGGQKLIRRSWAGLVLSAMLCSGCVYYNTFFNANKLYREADNARVKANQDFAVGSASKSYEAAIKKASKVLQTFIIHWRPPLDSSATTLSATNPATCCTQASSARRFSSANP